MCSKTKETENACNGQGNEALRKRLDKAGVPSDGRWRALLMFMRSLHDYVGMTATQRNEMQRLVAVQLKSGDYSPEAFDLLLKKQEAIVSAKCVSKLESAMTETKLLIKEFQGLIESRKNDVNDLGTFTVESIEQGSDPQELLHRLRTAFKEVVSAMERDAENLEQLSITDPLTRINNRRALDEYLEESVAMAREEEYPISVLMLDVDHFKDFNDTYGHRIGDQALITVARMMKEYVSGASERGMGDFFPARYGGEEFCVVLPGVDQAEAVQIADVLREKIGGYDFVIRNSQGEVLHSGIKITVSIGAAALRGEWKGAFVEHLVEAADKALYAAKQAGRNRVEAYDPQTMASSPGAL